MNLLLLGEIIKRRFPVSRELENILYGRRAAVLAILFPKNGQICVLMIKRADHLERHAGEIAFPGGMVDDTDENLLHTALRETSEELQIDIAPNALVGRLTTVMTASEVNVTPFIALVSDLPRYAISIDEVQLALEIPLTDLFSSMSENPNPKQGGVVFVFEKHRIWGASAKILKEIAQLGISWQLDGPS